MEASKRPLARITIFEGRPNPYIREYEQKLGQLSLDPPEGLRIEFKDPNHREQGWKMSLTDGMPIPDPIVSDTFMGD